MTDRIGVIQGKRLVSVNEALASILGRPTEQLVGKVQIELLGKALSKMNYSGDEGEYFDNVPQIV